MPIHLPPLTRRNFLKRSLLAGAGLTAAPSLWAASPRTNPDSWVFFSDTHIAAEPDKVARGINMSEHLQSAAREVLALPERPTALFLTGDCAFNSGGADDYIQFARLLQPLREGGFPLHLTLGNHDNRERFWSSLPPRDAARKVVKDRQAALIKSPKVNWYMLDSLETTLQTPGLVGPEQLQWLAKSLDANPQRPAIVMVHHQPGSAAKDAGGGLKDTPALLEILRPRRQVKAWVFGHTHTWVHREDESGLHFVNLPPVAYVFHEGDPSGWVHVTMRKDGADFQLNCLDHGHKQHRETLNLKWRSA